MEMKVWEVGPTQKHKALQLKQRQLDYIIS